MRFLSTINLANELAKHKNNANEAAMRTMANEAAKQENDAK